MSEERTIKYIGDGLSIPGVPARDLSPAEYETYKAAIEVCPSKLYEVPKAAKKSAQAKETTGKE